MVNSPNSKIVADCVSQCSNWSKPLPEISAYVQELIKLHGWPAAEANDVGRRALAIINPLHPLLTQADERSPRAAALLPASS